MDFLQILFSPETPAHLVSSVPLKPLCECREVHGESHLKQAVWSPWHLRCLALLREDPCRCFLNLFAPSLPAGDTEKCRESSRRQRAALSKRLQAAGLSATVNAEQMVGATLGWLSTERLPLSMINHLCWGGSKFYLAFVVGSGGAGNLRLESASKVISHCLSALWLLTGFQDHCGVARVSKKQN